MFRYNGTEKLRCGYTTGTCAAAAAGAAAVYLLTGKAPSEISVRLPGGDVLRLPVSEPFADEHSADCGIVKDSGDDPDITNGITVRAAVTRAPEGITITGGEGIGKVTKPGLDQPVGEWAINSIPRRMIAETLAETAERLGYEGGFLVKLYVPGGAAIAEKTYNPHMGILGGISIIGTTGIVEPMSTRALIETIRTEAAMHRAQGET
ncbi:MAG: cobalt-precorrin-5B (C(1))-methyltransferase, partial [Oscillospiraceae bacterium]|nr:cobalt-precorrin-5B (C(1))-methyltransferase [Oscillospiraceae bacterium]